jgi:hypothetical protein
MNRQRTVTCPYFPCLNGGVQSNRLSQKWGPVQASAKENSVYALIVSSGIMQEFSQ